MSVVRELTTFEATRSSGQVSALLVRPSGAEAVYVLAHGAGAGMRHAFMEAMAGLLAERGVATFRYQFPYMEQGKRAPSPRPVLLKTVRSAVAAAAEAAPGLPLVAGGKSMGGRMTSLAAAEEALPGVRGIAFLGFPLHGIGKPPNTERSEHLGAVGVPMLFVQGTRDKLAKLELLEPVVRELGGHAAVHVIEHGDHSFKVPKRSGRSQTEALAEAADAVSGWVARILSAPG